MDPAVLVTLACNNGCLFCAQGGLGERVAPTTDETRQRISEAARLASGSAGVVALVGGEPTLREDLPELVALARREGASGVLVQTNGRRLAYPTYAKALREAGVTAVDVSLHGSTAAMHDYHTAVPGSFVQTVTGLRTARGAGLRVAVTTVVTRSNYRHLVEVVRLVHACGVRALRLSTVRALGRARGGGPALQASPELLRPHLDAADKAARALSVSLLIDPVTPRTAVSSSASPTSASVDDEALVAALGAPPALTAGFAGLGVVEGPSGQPASFVSLPTLRSKQDSVFHEVISP